MTVRELKEYLAPFADGIEIVLSNDEEGNQFSPLVSANPSLYKPHTDTVGATYSLDDKRAIRAGAKQVIVLWPKC